MSINEHQFNILPSQFVFTAENFKQMSKLRIIQKNLVHVQGFPNSLADKSLLSRPEYFGQFGKIKKLVIVSKSDDISKKNTNSAYITYSSKEEASFAILSIDSIIIDGHVVRAFFGTTKYCIHFLNNVECFNKDKCMFLHSLANESDILGSGSKFGYAEHINLAKEIVNFTSMKTKSYIMNMVISYRTVLPNMKSIYERSVNNIYNDFILDDVNNKEIPSVLFKYKNKSRFFKGNDNNKENVNIIPNNILELVDRLLKRMSFFMQFDKCLSMKKYQLIYCKLKYQNRKDAWINFIINNTK